VEYAYLAFKEGGPFMYVILLTLIFGLAILIERYIAVGIKNRIDSTKFVNRIMEMIQSGSISGAIEYCSMSNASLPRITRAGLQEHGGSAADIQQAFELAAMSEIPKLEKRTQYLAMIANVATLLGLLGTIFGLIIAFQSITDVEATQKAALLSRGISMAMNTTAFGLIVAIPCLMGYSFLQERTNLLIDDINESVARIYRGLINTNGRR
jgi:biopolymer transport protein ExbB